MIYKNLARNLFLPGLSGTESKYPGVEMDVQPTDDGMRFSAWDKETKYTVTLDRPDAWFESGYKNSFGPLCEYLASKVIGQRLVDRGLVDPEFASREFLYPENPMPEDFAPEFSIVDGNPTMTVRDGNHYLALGFKLSGDQKLDGRSLHTLRDVMWMALENRRLDQKCSGSEHWKCAEVSDERT